jgi:hypothetical protein
MPINTTVTWKQGLELPHDPDDINDIEMDLTAVVGDTDTLSEAAVTAVGVTGAKLSSTPQGIVAFRVSGGTAGEDSSVTVQITMTNGRKQSRTTNFNVLER